MARGAGEKESASRGSEQRLGSAVVAKGLFVDLGGEHVRADPRQTRHPLRAHQLRRATPETGQSEHLQRSY